MINLQEIIHSISKEKKDGLVNVDDWKYPDIDHLVTMGFEFTDDFHMEMESPHIKIYKKKEKENDKDIEYFFIEEKDRSIKKFKSFSDVIDFFDHYEQPEIDKYKE